MNTNHLKGKIGRIIMAFSLLLGIVIASGVTTQAQYQQYPNDDYWRQQRQYEREQRRRQREYQREQMRRQREASRYGNYDYNDTGYGNYGNNGYGNYGYGVPYEVQQTALNAGYNAGIRAGRSDRSRGRGFDYADQSAFRNATTDYNSRFGDIELYRQFFRQGFVNGYTDGYRGY